MGFLSLTPVTVAVESGEEHGVLVLKGDALVAVLTCLADPVNGGDTGRWFLEAGFGPCWGRQDTFGTLEEALRWVAERSGLDVDSAVAHVLNGFSPPCPCA